MSYEPPSQIYDISKIVVLNQLPLNNDVISIIMSYDDLYLDPKDCMDTFWFKLGRETCNLMKWVDNSRSIVYSGFGKSSCYYNCLRPVSNLNGGPCINVIKPMRCKPDDMICKYYDVNSKDNILTISNVMSIMDIFYNNSNCKKYPYKVPERRRFSKVIQTEEKIYILNLILRLKQLKYYLEHYVINKILLEEKNMHKDLIKSVNKFGKSNDKLKILEDIPVEN